MLMPNGVLLAKCTLRQAIQQQPLGKFACSLAGTSNFFNDKDSLAAFLSQLEQDQLDSQLVRAGGARQGDSTAYGGGGPCD